MNIYELVGCSESHPVYQELEVSNGERHYDFLRSSVLAALGISRPYLSQTIIRAINFHAIACLHNYAGEYRPCSVQVGDFEPPAHHRVEALMDDFVNETNRFWEQTDSVLLAAYVLWRLCYIHPFINGNGRTARATAYFVLCVKSGGWLEGAPILPELLRRHRERYIDALKSADEAHATGSLNLDPLVQLISEQLNVQLNLAL